MKSKAGKTIGGLMVVPLALVMAVGCSGNKQSLVKNDVIEEAAAQEETMQDQTVQTAIANMDAYMTQLDEQQVSNVAIETTAVETTTVEIKTAEADMTQAEEVFAIEEETLPEMQPLQIMADSVQEMEESSRSAPKQKIFYFDTNSTVSADADNAALLQHAVYLQQHPEMVLFISGHADSRGAKAYNERLSAERAQNVAAILLAAGVSGAQLRINALGESVSQIDPDNLQENRRVEFSYQDSMVAKK